MKTESMKRRAVALVGAGCALALAKIGVEWMADELVTGGKTKILLVTGGAALAGIMMLAGQAIVVRWSEWLGAIRLRLDQLLEKIC